MYARVHAPGGVRVLKDDADLPFTLRAVRDQPGVRALLPQCLFVQRCHHGQRACVRARVLVTWRVKAGDVISRGSAEPPPPVLQVFCGVIPPRSCGGRCSTPPTTTESEPLLDPHQRAAERSLKGPRNLQKVPVRSS